MNIAKYVKTITPPDQITVPRLEHLASLITSKFATTTTTEIMLRLLGFGIPAADQWLRAQPDTSDN